MAIGLPLRTKTDSATAQRGETAFETVVVLIELPADQEQHANLAGLVVAERLIPAVAAHMMPIPQVSTTKEFKHR